AQPKPTKAGWPSRSPRQRAKAGGPCGTRTRTPFREADFKSAAYTSFAKGPRRTSRPQALSYARSGAPAQKENGGRKGRRSNKFRLAGKGLAFEALPDRPAIVARRGRDGSLRFGRVGALLRRLA